MDRQTMMNPYHHGYRVRYTGSYTIAHTGLCGVVLRQGCLVGDDKPNTHCVVLWDGSSAARTVAVQHLEFDLPTAPVAVKDTNPKNLIASNKIPLWLLSPIAKAHWAVAQAVGMVKYGAWNWRVSGVRSSIYLSAIERHFDRYLSGQDYDPVDGQHNLGAIMACCAILLDAEAAGKLNDDRPPAVPVQKTYDELEVVFKRAIERAQQAGLNPVHHTLKDNHAV